MPDAQPLGDEEGERHAAADDEHIDHVDEPVDHAELVRDLAAAEDGDERVLRVGQHGRQRLDLAGEQEPGIGRKELRDARGGGVRAVRGAERVVDVQVRE